MIGPLKLEHVHQVEYQSAPSAGAEPLEHIDSYDNIRRKHSAINYRTPSEFEQCLLTQN